MNALDKFDLTILRLLQQDATFSNAQLSERVNLSPSQCHRRVKRLEQEGYIHHYVALLDHRKLGLTVHAVVIIKVRDVSRESKAAFREQIRHYRLVTECWAIAGDKDVILKIVAPSLESYSDFLSEKILSMDNVASAESYLLLDNMKYTTEVPIGDHD
ncbi:Lrp/AsnC family transcriptional regulator [Oceanimonas sp. MB9]|uniref:Lrp/AsnC family transcriptional regulator n=1 Tax=Oceanimonas sp. MB9 TaxID=2588453 RepID=UPI0013F5B1AF|nr:Lrp/AsnC family transcriptional regulator [Oceanimonas sp. MB9]NHI01577.1 DNA-binding transcriptional activator DecR [Oceanimonas sp. MB9]